MHLLILGGSPADRFRSARAHVPSTHAIVLLDPHGLPFMRMDAVSLPAGPRAIVIDEAQLAFPDAQQGGTRLVLTQSTYLMQKWIDRLEEGDRIVATADRAALEKCAPEAFQGRGPWQYFDLVNTEDSKDAKESQTSVSSVSFVSTQPTIDLLARAFASNDTAERLRMCREAAARDAGCEVAQLALASACRESRDGGGARAALDRAAALDPQWEAVAFESGKLCLVLDDLAQARDAFQRAADLMPAFSAAFGNLGATLGELDRPEEALSAFRQALAHDPRSVTVLNNIGASCRELGRLEESEAAFQRAIDVDPAFVFAHYNLGHTLFLAGRYADALAAYEEGQRRDPSGNRRQGCRLAVVRLANGDAAGAERDFWRFADAAPADERDDLLLEAYEIVQALFAQHPALAVHQPFLDRIGAEIVKSE